MNSKKQTLVSVCLLLVAGGVMGGLFFLPVVEILSTSGWGAFFGQVLLTRGSGGIDPKHYRTYALLLGEIKADEVIGGRYIYLPDVAYFWDPEYPGFPEATLSRGEVLQIIRVLQSSTVYTDQVDGHQCYFSDRQSWKPCEDGEYLTERFSEVRFSAERANRAYSLQVMLEGDLFADYRLYLDEGDLAFEATQPNQTSLYGMALVENGFFDAFTQRVTEKPIPFLWEDRSAEKANRIASRRLGEGFDRALDLLQASRVLKNTLGDVDVIRPAIGQNRTSFWMDSSYIQLSFYVHGARGEGAVLMRGYRCIDAELIFQGELIELFQGEGC